MAKAFLITLEGIDGCGKTTQIETITDYFAKKGLPYTVTREPGSTQFGSALRQLLLSDAIDDITIKSELLLFLASRIELIDKVILPNLQKGVSVISDRFYDSTTAYQGSQLGMDYIVQLQQILLPECTPDLTLYYDIDSTTAIQRTALQRKLDNFEQRKIQQFDKIIHCYQQLAKRHPKRIYQIDAKQDKHQVAIQTLELVARLLK